MRRGLFAFVLAALAALMFAAGHAEAAAVATESPSPIATATAAPTATAIPSPTGGLIPPLVFTPAPVTPCPTFQGLTTCLPDESGQTPKPPSSRPTTTTVGLVGVPDTGAGTGSGLAEAGLITIVFGGSVVAVAILRRSRPTLP